MAAQEAEASEAKDQPSEPPAKVAVQEAEASEAKDQPSKPPRNVTAKVPVDVAVMLSPSRASLADVEAWGVAAWSDHDVYIGREDLGRGLPASHWANPYKIIPGRM